VSTKTFTVKIADPPSPALIQDAINRDVRARYKMIFMNYLS